MDLIRPGRTQIVGLAAFPFHCGEIKSPHRVIYVEEGPARLQVSDFDHRPLQTLLDANQLPHEIRGSIIRLARARGVEETHVNCRNVVIQKIFARQQV